MTQPPHLPTQTDTPSSTPPTSAEAMWEDFNLPPSPEPELPTLESRETIPMVTLKQLILHHLEETRNRLASSPSRPIASILPIYNLRESLIWMTSSLSNAHSQLTLMITVAWSAMIHLSQTMDQFSTLCDLVTELLAIKAIIQAMLLQSLMLSPGNQAMRDMVIQSPSFLWQTPPS